MTAIARVHVNDYTPEVYTGKSALELALFVANAMREDFPGAIVGVSYNPQAADERRADTERRLGLEPAGREAVWDA